MKEFLSIFIFLTLFTSALFVGEILDVPKKAFVRDCVTSKHRDVETCEYLYRHNLPAE